MKIHLSLIIITILGYLINGSKLRSTSGTSNNNFPFSLQDIGLYEVPAETLTDKLGSKFDSFINKFRKQSKISSLNSRKIVKVSRNQVNTLEKVHKTKILNSLSFFKGGANKNNKKKILILMSDTGGGHRASAQALDQAIQEQYPGKIDVQIMDIWTEYAAWPYNNFVPMYRYLAKHPLLWRGMYGYGLFPPTKKWTEFDSKRTCYKNFRKAIESADPDFVVSVHPLCQLMPISIVKEMNKKRQSDKPRIPFVTVVTDLGSAHSTWFDKRADAVFVPSEAVRDIALKCGMPSSKILMKGLPIRPSFWKASLPKTKVRKILGLPEKTKTVLLMGGGDGVGGIDKIASQLTNQLKKLNFNSQLIVICGHNKKVSESLLKKLKPDEHLKICVKGFVDNIDEFMTASDCLITKAGPGTIAESMIRGLPMVISSYLPGQVL